MAEIKRMIMEGGMAFGPRGRPLPLAPDDVNHAMNNALQNDKSKVMLLVVETGNNLVVGTNGPPTQALLAKLEGIVELYRTMLKGQ